MANTISNITNYLRLAIALLSVAISLGAKGAEEWDDSVGYNIIELKSDTLPSLNIARAGHLTLCIDGQLTVFGGHGDGFVPTPSAEYLQDDDWHTVPLIYTHDNGAGFRLRSGKVFLAGGHQESLGIGQLFSVELYDPISHTSHGRGCMNRKRAYPNAIELSDGQVVISGNWYADDGIEMFENLDNLANTNAVGVKESAVARAMPYILRISDDDAIIFSSLDNKNEPITNGIIDRLRGPSYQESFLDIWQPIRTINIHRSYNQFIGKEAEGLYEWLIPVENNSSGQIAIARITGPTSNSDTPTFALLPTRQPLPDSIRGKHIVFSSLVCDTERGTAYLIGDDNASCIFVVAVQYNSPEPSPLTVYIAENQPILAQSVTPVLSPKEGNLVFAGGRLVNNFTPINTVISLPLGDYADNGNPLATNAQIAHKSSKWWIWVVIGVLICCIAISLIIKRMNRSQPYSCEPISDDLPNPMATSDTDENPQLDKNQRKEGLFAELFVRIKQLMDEEKIFLNANLKISDVATRLGSNNSYVAETIKAQCGCSFKEYLNSYRITYAQELMRCNPESKISYISTMSGFSNDSTFFRAFRAVTGMSPKEWLADKRLSQ